MDQTLFGGLKEQFALLVDGERELQHNCLVKPED
jgi:hypothetical protein